MFALEPREAENHHHLLNPVIYGPFYLRVIYVAIIRVPRGDK